MHVSEISLDVNSNNPNDLPRVGETLQVSLMRMDEPQEFTVSATNVKRRWLSEGGGDDGYIYEGSITLEAVYEDDDEEDDAEEEHEPIGSAAAV